MESKTKVHIIEETKTIPLSLVSVGSFFKEFKSDVVYLKISDKSAMIFSERTTKPYRIDEILDTPLSGNLYTQSRVVVLEAEIIINLS